MKKNNYVGLVTGDECWLYLNHPTDSVWIGVDEQTPERARKVIGSQKVMITVSWGADGIWHIHALPHGKSMTSATFINDILRPLFGKMHEGIEHLDQVYVHFDNATSHNAKLTTQYLNDNKIIRIAHPAYSPDLSPSDCFLFGYMKGKLKGNSFKTAEEAVDAAKKTSMKFLNKCQNHHSTTGLPEHST
ncbi:MAG: putative mariner transposase [Streblomastix strix]|uniref:Putative mariner transposase n=1 Tax=Streblomastix strix TaxID=222440 RepID=A0A5J4X8Q6_9EUKA|nr:MAG: putative mariner transposase [Streblomastix strix]